MVSGGGGRVMERDREGEKEKEREGEEIFVLCKKFTCNKLNVFLPQVHMLKC